LPSHQPQKLQNLNPEPIWPYSSVLNVLVFNWHACGSFSGWKGPPSFKDYLKISCLKFRLFNIHSTVICWAPTVSQTLCWVLGIYRSIKLRSCSEAGGGAVWETDTGQFTLSRMHM
jgi:hypothetical protein